MTGQLTQVGKSGIDPGMEMAVNALMTETSASTPGEQLFIGRDRREVRCRSRQRSA